MRQRKRVGTGRAGDLRQRQRAVGEEMWADAIIASEHIGLEGAAKRYGVSPETLRKKRSALRHSSLVQEKRKDFGRQLRGDLVRLLRKALHKSEELVANATVDQLRDVMGVVKIAGDLCTLREMVADGEQPDDHQPGPPAPEAPPGAGGQAPAGSNGHAPAVH